ncbi:F-box protein CPR1-like [Salvia splendens]|uniref:F-box protein CPR1-like n=1 Tax=Salvia splendens TaxID=180675 RepID=UPI001C281120|nr:F-box protein CPR1-like [Salvia splendens]
MNLSRCKIFEIEDKDEADLESHDLHYVPLTDFDIPHGSRKMRVTAADGLLLLYSYIDDPETLHVCNPLTREYIVLCRPKDNTLFDCMFAFCVSKISGQYKVVCIGRTFYESDYFLVYTLGTGIWRPVETSAAYAFILYHYGHVGYNGNLHYIVTDLVQHSFQLCGFDAETECFSIFSPPPAIALPIDGDVGFYFEMTVFRDCLCICYIQDCEIIIWLMKEYRVEESWTKLSTIGFDFDFGQVVNFVHPIKVFKDGDILMLLNGYRFIFYSNKTKTIQRVGMFNDANAGYFFSEMIFTPSLFSLKSFESENVFSF